MHTTSSRSAKSAKAARSAVFAANWKSPRYLAMHALKERLFAAWNYADFYKKPNAEALLARFYRAVRALRAFEDRALLAAGIQP